MTHTTCWECLIVYVKSSRTVHDKIITTMVDVISRIHIWHRIYDLEGDGVIDEHGD